MSINPLDPESLPEGLVNIVSGRVGPVTVNVKDSLEVGREHMTESETTWPENFHDTIEKKITTMAVMPKSVRVGATKVFDTNLIYSRVVGLQASSRQVDIKEVLAHELHQSQHQCLQMWKR